MDNKKLTREFIEDCCLLHEDDFTRKWGEFLAEARDKGGMNLSVQYEKRYKKYRNIEIAVRIVWYFVTVLLLAKIVG